MLLALGVDPFAYYGYVAQRGLFSWLGLQQTLTRMAPPSASRRRADRGLSRRHLGISASTASSSCWGR
ncbi:MAG: hypothetical protein R3D28_14890 [Geminicoccaceae bacterium]